MNKIEVFYLHPIIYYTQVSVKAKVINVLQSGLFALQYQFLEFELLLSDNAKKQTIFVN